MTCFQAVISNSASCDGTALRPDGLDADDSTRLNTEQKDKQIKRKRRELKLKIKIIKKQIHVMSNA